MICNNTNIPAIENIISGCNNGCEPKDINIVCRKMIIPSGQEILCVQGDNNSTIRNFVIPNVTENGVSLKDKILNIVLENSKKEYFRINLKNEDIIYLDSYIKIKWNIANNETAVSGKLQVAIEAVGDNFKWQTYAGEFIIIPSLENIKRKIIPTVVLQKKIVFPKVVVQNILPDENYDGLSEVIVNPVTSEIDNNIKPENIKEKVSILGIEGSLIELNGEEITINSSREDKEIYPTEGKNAITKINLKAIKFNLQNKEIVENGKYTADKQYDGLGEVIINVQSAPVEQLYSYSEEVWN